jgi:hypothetical protein
MMYNYSIIHYSSVYEYMTVIIPDLLCPFLLRDSEKCLLNLIMIGMPWEGNAFEIKL